MEETACDVPNLDNCGFNIRVIIFLAGDIRELYFLMTERKLVVGMDIKSGSLPDLSGVF